MSIVLASVLLGYASRPSQTVCFAGESKTFAVTVEVRSQDHGRLTRSMVVREEQVRAIHLGPTKRLRIEGIRWEKERAVPLGAIVRLQVCWPRNSGPLIEAKRFARVLRGNFPRGYAWLDTHRAMTTTRKLSFGEPVHIEADEGTPALTVTVEDTKRPAAPVAEEERLLLEELAVLRMEASMTEYGQERLQRILGPEWRLIGKATSHERGGLDFWNCMQRDEQHTRGCEGVIFRFQHRTAKVPAGRKADGQPAHVSVWFRPRAAYEPSLWLGAEAGPFPTAIGAYDGNRSAGVCGSEVIRASIEAPQPEALAEKLRSGFRVSLKEMPSTALIAITPNRRDAPTVHILDGRPRPGAAHESASFFLVKALTAGGGEVKTRVWEGSAPDLGQLGMGETQRSVLILASIEGLADRCVASIRKYVQRGNGLLVLLGPMTDDEWFNRKLAAEGLLPGKVWGCADKRKQLALDLLNPIHSALEKARIRSLGKATQYYGLERRADAWPVGGRASSWACDGVTGEGRTMLVGLPLDGSWSTAPRRRSFLPWITETVKYLATPPAFAWGATEKGLRLSLRTMCESCPGAADVHIVAVLHNTGEEAVAVVEDVRSETGAWQLLIDGKESPVSPSGTFVPAQHSFRTLAPDASLALDPKGHVLYHPKGKRPSSWVLEPGRHTIQTVYRIDPRQRSAERPRLPIWTGEVRSNILTLHIGNAK